MWDGVKKTQGHDCYRFHWSCGFGTVDVVEKRIMKQNHSEDTISIAKNMLMLWAILIEIKAS